MSSVANLVGIQRVRRSHVRVVSAAMTHAGRRAVNEDSCCTDEAMGLFAIADGMGGHKGGSLASRLVISTLRHYISSHFLAHETNSPREESFLRNEPLALAIEMAHQVVCFHKCGDVAEMGSTLTALWIDNRSALIANVGDSRIYRLRKGRIRQLTCDHSLFVEVYGKRNRSCADRESFAGKNIITRAIGMPRYKPDITHLRVRPGDRYLLCSDGLNERLKDDELALVLSSGSPRAACHRLVSLAVRRETKDNITAIVVQAFSDR